jgi:citrate synthase
VPGFGQPLYPDGDPRCRALHAPDPLADAVAVAGLELLNEHPNVDFGLVAMARAHGLPPAAPAAIFALGRSAGWIAHAIEQYASGALIRPRARYTGPQPSPDKA